jgi:hypothetical protein
MGTPRTGQGSVERAPDAGVPQDRDSVSGAHAGGIAPGGYAAMDRQAMPVV